MKTYYREADGHTYYFKNGVLFAAPTFQDGAHDVENELPVSDFEEPLRTDERVEIEGALHTPC